MQIHDLIKHFIKKNKMTQKEFAKKSKLTEASVSQILNKKRSPNLSTILKIKKVIKFNFDSLK